MRQAVGLAPLSLSMPYSATAAHLGVGGGGVSRSGGDALPPLQLPPLPVTCRDLAAPSPLPPSAPSPLPPSAPAMLLLQAPLTAKTDSDSAWHVLVAVENERKGTPPPPECKLPASFSSTQTPLRLSLDLHESRLASSPSAVAAPLAAPLAAVPQAPLSRPKVFFGSCYVARLRFFFCVCVWCLRFMHKARELGAERFVIA